MYKTEDMKNILKTYANTIYEGLEPEFASLIKCYSWPKDSPPNIEDTIKLRASMARRWNLDPEATAVAAVEWGGLVYNRNARNKEFSYGDPREIVERTCRTRSNWGMATWTKILAVRDPNRYFIFDARVSLALNQYCADKEYPFDFFFPELSSRSKERNYAQRLAIEKLDKLGAKPFSSCSSFYFDFYCPLIIALANKLSSDSKIPVIVFNENQLINDVRESNIINLGFDILPHFVEMALFMKGGDAISIAHSVVNK
ncbi:hypothetical protein [uncultured Sutterella sp.]|uniref:hypothetical protein n=1 Tax=uncultured Sutterella sp. TaxID=286133 RepID=UPI00262F8937|nr:hypothetical protein [uncultured Sutterella sp.]